ncbi:butyrophilin-like protein 2, partial [Astyanax mexicanus]
LFYFLLGLHVLGPTDPLTVRLGGSLMLPCSTETLIPLEELEVEWMRTDSESLVHLFQDGEIRPESQNQAYSGRASFFTEEIKHGNFSLLLTNITTEDAGVYNCSVYRQDESAQTSVQIKRLTVTGGHVISAKADEAVTLNCSVDSHIPPEEMEEVSWKKVDQDILVLMFQDGEVKTESAHGSYMGRVEFFSLDEISKGNFSLRLKDLRTEDKGLYMCEVLSGEFSANATVEVQQLGLHVLGPTDPLTVKLGGSLMLPCYTETIIPLEELEVVWMRTDSKSLVNLFQDGEIRPESQNQAYSGRASFFTEEIKHGNFSLLLTNITTEDAGVYNCSVYRQDESAQTSVQIKEIGEWYNFICRTV